uniref:Uncharacterized protein n=1 Tax=Anguilla anguilla TaxID=7936 RepID=A0A0E9VJ32_ANGAN
MKRNDCPDPSSLAPPTEFLKPTFCLLPRQILNIESQNISNLLLDVCQ